jgi:hypothetical protein
VHAETAVGRLTLIITANFALVHAETAVGRLTLIIPANFALVV